MVDLTAQEGSIDLRRGCEANCTPPCVPWFLQPQANIFWASSQSMKRLSATAKMAKDRFGSICRGLGARVSGGCARAKVLT